MMEDLDDGISQTWTECACPRCGVVHKKRVDIVHINSPYAWRRGGFLVILCKGCRTPRVSRHYGELIRR